MHELPLPAPSVCNHRRRRGAAILITAVCVFVLVGMLGIAIDIGRLYVAKTELQAFADAAALASARELDGTATGLARSEALATTGPGGTKRNRWNLGNQPVANVDVQFSDASTGGWLASGSVVNPSGYRFVKVRAWGESPILFLRVFPADVGDSSRIGAVAIAGQGKDPTGWCGKACDPFSPDAINVADANFGYTPGVRYTIKWAPSGQRKKAGGMCPGEKAAGYEGPKGDDRGYIDVGQDNGNSNLHDAITNHEFDPIEMKIGDTIDIVPGNKHVGPAMETRFGQDTDVASNTFADYKVRGTGNGRRLLRVPINDPSTDRIIGFATFFMQAAPETCGKNQDPCCAEYVSPGLLAWSRWAPASPDPTAVFKLKLFSGGL